MRQTAPHPIVGPRASADYFRNSLLALYRWGAHANEYTVGVLNSRLMRFCYVSTTHEARQKAFPQVKIRSLRALPIRAIDFSNADDVAAHDKMVSLVETMLDLQERIGEANTPTDRKLLERQIATTDNQIDRLVYKLYELTDEEIGIVEDAAQTGP